MYQQAYLDQLNQEIDDGWTTVMQISSSMVSYKGLAVPKPLDVQSMTDQGIITDSNPA